MALSARMRKCYDFPVDVGVRGAQHPASRRCGGRSPPLSGGGLKCSAEKERASHGRFGWAGERAHAQTL